MVEPAIIANGTSTEKLTPRENEVLKLIAKNMSDREIADQLILSVNSVKWYARRIYEKLEVTSRQKAVRKARNLGLLDDELPRSLHHNLPRQLSRLVGRSKEITEVVELVWKYNLVTLTGCGGVGKTRLALATASEMLDDFQDGVCYVDLASLSNSEMVTLGVMNALGIVEDPGRSRLESMIFYFNNRQVLLILDNCEHLAEACAQMVQAILTELNDLKVLVSSREPLDVDGEVIYRVPSLSCPMPDQSWTVPDLIGFDSVQLFVERAKEALPVFEINSQNCAAVAEICQRLDGIPLAIELAASRCASLGIAQIAERLEHSFHLLTGGRRTKMERHRTLYSAIQWSYELISKAERIMLRRLGIFMGGWTLRAAEEVCAGDGILKEDILELLSLLVKKSLVLVDHLEDREPRYRMLATIKEFALEELFRSGETESMQKKHFQWAANLAAEAGPNLYTGKRLEWMIRLKKDHNNLRYALSWALEEKNDAHGGLEILSKIGEQYWNFYDCSDALHLLELGYEMIMAEPAPSFFLQVSTLHRLGFACCITNPAQSMQYIQKAFSFSDQLGPDAKILRACVLTLLGEKMSNELGDLQRGLNLISEAEAILRASGSEGIWDLGHAINCKAWTLRFMGNEAAAQVYFDEYTSLILELGDIWGCVFWYLADGAWRRNEFDLAKKYCEEYRARSREMEWEVNAAHIDRMLANWERARGKYAEALPLYRNALALYNIKAVIWGVFLTLIGLASNQVGTAQSMSHENSSKMLNLSTQLLAAIQRIQEEYHTMFYFEDRQIYEQALACVKNQMEPADFNSAWAIGRALHLKQIVNWALENMK